MLNRCSFLRYSRAVFKDCAFSILPARALISQGICRHAQGVTKHSFSQADTTCPLTGDNGALRSCPGLLQAMVPAKTLGDAAEGRE